MVNSNSKVSSINLCPLIMVKPGIMEVIQNMRSRNPEELLNTSPAIIVEKNNIIQETMSSLHLKKTQRVCRRIQEY